MALRDPSCAPPGRGGSDEPCPDQTPPRVGRHQGTSRRGDALRRWACEPALTGLTDLGHPMDKPTLADATLSAILRAKLWLAPPGLHADGPLGLARLVSECGLRSRYHTSGCRDARTGLRAGPAGGSSRGAGRSWPRWGPTDREPVNRAARLPILRRRPGWRSGSVGWRPSSRPNSAMQAQNRTVERARSLDPGQEVGLGRSAPVSPEGQGARERARGTLDFG